MAAVQTLESLLAEAERCMSAAGANLAAVDAASDPLTHEQATSRLAQTLQGLRAGERALLDQVRAAGGIVPLEELARRHPAFRQDSWFWERTPPEEPLGRLRFLQLLGFGRLDSQDEPVAFLPLEVREFLS